MTETLQLQSPLTNEELTRHLDLEAQAHVAVAADAKKFDPKSPNYDSAATLHNASYGWLQERADDPDQPPFVDVNGRGEHELSAERMEADVDELSSWVDNDLRELRTAINSPKEARAQMRRRLGHENGDAASISGDNLSFKELHDYIEWGMPRGENDADTAMHNLSLNLVGALVRNWEHEQHMGPLRGRLARQGIGEDDKVDLNARVVEGQSSLYEHMSIERERIQREFHEINAEKIRQLGKKVTDAAGVRERIGERPSVEVADTTQAGGGVKEPDPAAEAARRLLDPQNVERASGYEQLDRNILQLAMHRTQVNVNLASGHRNIGDGPSNERGIAFMDREQGGIIQTLEGNPDWREHPNEAVSFSSLVEPDTITTFHDSIEKRTAFGGKKIEYIPPTTEPHPRAGQPILMRNELTGQDEPVVRFRYNFRYSWATKRSGEAPRYLEYRGGRDGGHVMVGLDLPKSVAGELQARLQSDPVSVRPLIEQLVLKNSNGAVSEHDWREGEFGNPVRPPYEGLPKGWQLTIVSGSEVRGGDGRTKKGYKVRQLPLVA